MPDTMRAMRIHELGGSFRLEAAPVPRPGPSDALLRLRATGLGLTLVIMRKTPGLISRYPRTMGHEIAGEVVEVGAEVGTVRPGDLVTAHFYLTCHNCNFCRSGRETLCPDFRGYVGLACDGGYAEYMTLPAVNLCKVPEGVSALDACVAADAICTPYHNCVAEAQIKPGDLVAVVGAGGGVAIHAVQMAQVCGGRVIGVDVSEKKLETVSRLGAFAVVNPRKSDPVEEILSLTQGKGVDAYIDYVASKQTLEAGLACLGRGGKLVIVGYRPPMAFGGLSPDFTVNPLELLSKGQEIHGSRYCSMLELRQSLELIRQGRIKPVVTETFKLEETEKGFQMLEKNEITGRAAVVFG